MRKRVGGLLTKESMMRTDPKIKMQMGALGLLAAALLVGAAFFTYRASALRAKAASITTGEPVAVVLPIWVMLQLGGAAIMGTVSARLLVRSRRKDAE